MALSRDALAEWLWHYCGVFTPENVDDEWGIVDDESRKEWLDRADALALQFRLPLDSDGAGITRCTCGHPVGNHRNGNGACRDKALTLRGTDNCKCQSVSLP